MAKNKYEYKNKAERATLLATNSNRFLVLDSSEIIDEEGIKKHYLTFDDIDPEPERTKFKGLDFAALTPEKVDNYIDTNVTTMATAIPVLKQLTKAVVLLAKKQGL